MAVDLSIQLFAYELFNHLWADFGGNVCRAVPENIIPESLNVESHITSEIIDAVSCRQMIFQEKYMVQFERTNISSHNSPSDFLANLSFAFYDKSFTKLKIFDRMFATCAFAIEMSIHCCVQGNKFFLKDDYLCWAMYFDTALKSEFYKQGGWKVLKSVAKSYVLPLFALQTLNSTPFFIHRNIGKYVTAVNDFCYFQTFEDQGNQTCAKSWVNFRLRNAKNPRSNNTLSDIKDLEEFLTCFRFLCDPLGERILEGDARIQNENICSKFKGNEYLEKLSRKLSNCHPSYPTKQNDEFQDGLISSTPEVFQEQTDTDKALIMTMQALGIEHLSNDKSIDHALTTKKSTFYNTLLNDSQVSETNEDESKIGISEEEYKKLWHQVLETSNCDVTTIDLDRKLQEQDLLNNIVLHDVPFDEDLTLNTKNIENNNLLKDDKSVHQNLKENNDWYMKRSMKVDSIHAALSHASVYMEDPDTIHTENEFAPNETCQAKENSNACVVKNETSQMNEAASLEGQEIQNVTKNKKKKKRKTKSGKSDSNLSTDNTVKQETDTDDTKDILRMVLVLGCQPGLNYIRSTLKQACKTTSV